MERRQRPADETWDRPRYGGSGSAQHPPWLRPEAPPNVLYPGGPWESRPPYEGSEQRPRRDYTQQGHNEPLQHGGPPGMPPFTPLHPGVFPGGGARPGMPPHGPMEQIGSQPRLPHVKPADLYGSDGLQAPSIPTDVSSSQHRAPEGLMHYNVPRHGTPEAGYQGRPLHAMPHQDVSEHRQRSQDVGRHHNTMYQPGERPANVQRHGTMYQPGERPANIQHHDTMCQPGERPSKVQHHDIMYQPDQPPVQRHDTMFQPGKQPPVQHHDTMFQPGERPTNVQHHDTMYQPEQPPVQCHDTMYQPEQPPVQRHDTMFQQGKQPPVQNHDTMFQPGERPANVQRHDVTYQPGEQLPTIQRHDSMYQPGVKPANVQLHNAIYQPGERPPTVQCHGPMYQSGERHPNVQHHDSIYQSGEQPNVQCHGPMYQSGEKPPNVQIHDTMYQPDKQPPNLQRHGVHQHTANEHKDPMYSERPQPRSEPPKAYQPADFHQAGPNSFRGLDPALAQYGGPDGFHRDNRSNLHLPYQNEGSQPGLHSLKSPPVPDTFSYRAPSPGTQQFSTQLQPVPTQTLPYTGNPQQGHYHLPPMHGRQPNPSYTFPPLEGSAFNGSSKEEDLEDPSFQRSHNHSQHLLEQQQSVTFQDIRRGPEPPVPYYFKPNVPFSQQEVADGQRNPHLLPQHSVPFVPQPTPHSEDSFIHLDRHTELENNGPSEKDVFMHWLSGFLSCRKKTLSTKPVAVQTCSITEARGLIYGALQLVSQLDSLCQALESSNKAGEPWGHDYIKAAGIRVDLEKRLEELEKPGYIQGVKMKLNRVQKKRLRWQRRKQVTEEEEKASSERSAEKEARIDQWRMQCIQKVEEKKRERELKATADSVLGEVRKKKNDVKKMLDVLKALEKLRKLRKEAAGRKGVHPPPSADETFANHIQRLRTMVHKRSALYDAEEKTLRVILEGEQEEERQREKDKRQRKEKEKIMQKQRELDSILFGDAEPLPALHPLLPFRQYYLQAEHSVVSLVKIRREWDQFLVPPDHPEGSSIPRGWVVPTVPSNDTWASALKPSD